ncbi:hypothetical protein J4G37_41805, partial [Microvirga sp. 3-52]|nr:hypothetical protein [Microvirga sp. 3-52]
RKNAITRKRTFIITITMKKEMETMKKKVKVLFLAFCLISSFTMSHGFEKTTNIEIAYDTISSKKGPGSPIEVMPPQT